MLLPDGRVLSAGGGSGENYTSHPNAELYSPPYLFGAAGPRPDLTNAPSIVGYQEQFGVATSNPAAVARVTLVRLSSVTHSFNMNQRFLELGFTPAGPGTLTVTAPANAICPPGQYLLFVLDGQGIPSVGRVITIDVNRCPPVISFTETQLNANLCQVTLGPAPAAPTWGATRAGSWMGFCSQCPPGSYSPMWCWTPTTKW